MEKEQLFKKRILDLCHMAYERDIVTFSDFLGLNELHMMNYITFKDLGVSVQAFGGYKMSERQMLAFIPDTLGYEWSFPIQCIKISLQSPKYAEKLSHRDYLGALINLGIDRGKLGDIVVNNSDAFVFCEASMANFIMHELCRVRHTNIALQLVEETESFTGPDYIEIKGTVASVRLDSVIATAFSTSRSSIVPLIEGGKVFVNGKLIVSNGYSINENDIISVRGKGKFCFKEILSKTKKGRSCILLYKYN